MITMHTIAHLNITILVFIVFVNLLNIFFFILISNLFSLNLNFYL